MIDIRITDALNNWSGSVVGDDIPDSLPLIDLFQKLPRNYRPRGRRPLGHPSYQLGTDVPLVRAFVMDGVAEGRMWHVDILRRRTRSA